MDKPSGFNVRMDSEAQPRLVLPMYIWFRVPEFFVVADNPVLPKAAGAASFCIYAVDPAAHRIEVFPQDWFNDGTPNYGYQWITCATRDPATRRLLVSGIRIDNFILDETGRRIEQRLPR